MATFAVIFAHVSAIDFLSFSLSTDWYVSLIGDSLVRWCVPVFVMISGALFLNPNRQVSYREVLTIRIPRLLIVYVFWSVMYVLYDFYRTDFEAFSLWHIVRRSLISQIHLWFLPMLMGVYLLIPILRKIAQNKKLMCYTLIIWIIYITGSFFQFVEPLKIAKHFYPLFKTNIIIGFAGYFLLGYYLFQHTFSKKQKTWIYLFGIVGALVTIFGTYYVSVSKGEPNERYFSNLSIQVMAMAVALFVLIKELEPRFGKAVLKFNGFVRKDLFGIYLTHAFWPPVVNTPAFRHCCNEVITLPLIALIIFTLSLFLTKLIRMIPILRKVVE